MRTSQLTKCWTSYVIFHYHLARWFKLKIHTIGRGGSRINFRVLKNFTKRNEYRHNVICRKIIDLATYSFDYSRSTDLKVQLDSNKNPRGHPGGY